MPDFLWAFCDGEQQATLMGHLPNLLEQGYLGPSTSHWSLSGSKDSDWYMGLTGCQSSSGALKWH